MIAEADCATVPSCDDVAHRGELGSGDRYGDDRLIVLDADRGDARPSVAPGAGRRWLGVEFRHLGALSAVAREGSFRRAAQQLGYVQSVISAQIAHLERAVGAQLVERSSGSARATLTPTGEALLAHIEGILARFEAARIDLCAVAEGTEALVRIAVADGVGTRWMPRITRDFSRRFPCAHVIVDESRDEEADFARLASGDLDLMIAELPLPAGPFDSTLLEPDPYIALTGSGSLLAQQRSLIGLDQLARVPVLLPAPTRAADPLARKLSDRGVDQPPWLRPHGAAAVQALVGAGLGVGIVPSLAVDHDDEATVALSLAQPLPDRKLVLVRHGEREYTLATRAFIEIAEAAYAVG